MNNMGEGAVPGMTAEENMKKLLAQCGVYKLTGDTPLEWELAAYGAGFSLVEEALGEAEAGTFAATAPQEWLEEWEARYFSQPVQGDLATRRAMLKERLLPRTGPVTLADVPGLLLAAGIRGTAEETGGGLVITALEYLAPKAQAEKELGRLLPLHVPWTIAEAQ